MNKKSVLIFFAACGLSAQAFAQGGGISAQMLQEIQKNDKKGCAKERVIANAVYGMSIDALAKNYKVAATPLDTHFSVETRKQSITDQKSSGRCWMFSGLNVLRSNYMNHADSVSIEFSWAYLFFWDQLEKSNLMLQGGIDTAKKPIDDQRVQFF